MEESQSSIIKAKITNTKNSDNGNKNKEDLYENFVVENALEANN